MTSENPDVNKLSLDKILSSYLGSEGWIETILPTGGLNIKPIEAKDFQQTDHDPEPKEEDVELVMMNTTGISVDTARKTLRETNNDVVEAIMKLIE